MPSEALPSSENTVPSSPSGGAVFSDEPTRASSPPSSPPGFPWEQEKQSNDGAKALQRPVTNAFSMMGKRKALEPISDNARPSKRRASTATTNAKPSSANSKTLTQMQLSLGQEVQTKCKTCGMEYVPSSSEDRRLHDKYHKQNIEGFDVGKDFLQKMRPQQTVYSGARSGDWVCVVDCHDTPTRKKKGQAVLEVVQRELGAVEIPQEEIWDARIVDPGGGAGLKHVAYMYVRDQKCIGFLLVQKITEAYRVEEPTLPLTEQGRSADKASGALGQTKKGISSLAALKARQQAAAARLELLAKQPLVLSKLSHPASLGISRIWTSPTHRGQSIATTLLDTALERHNDSDARDRPHKDSNCEASRESPVQHTVKRKEEVAFSQPTEAGVKLARRWFGKMFGWRVYVD